MIHTTFDWSRPLNLVIAGALVLLLALQVWLQLRYAQRSSRLWLRVSLNGLLWLALAGYVLQLSWARTRPTTHALLVADTVPADSVRAVQARLGVSERFTTRNFTGGFAAVTLLGQPFTPPLLSRLSGADLRWIPVGQTDKLLTIHWQGIVRQGEMQRVSGRIESSHNQWLRLRYAGRVLDSLSLRAGNCAFALQAPAFVRGRTQLELTLGRSAVSAPGRADMPLDTIRFFAHPPEPMAYQFILDNPDFETKTLAAWLGRNGQAVQLTSTVSTGIRSSLTINQPKPRRPDVIITDPGNAANPVVKRAMLAGSRVFFMSLTNPDADIRTINQALGSRFSVQKLANAESVPVGKDLTALPFRFNPSLSQLLIADYPAAVQHTAGLVGVSLLNETFPLALSGDSLAYARLWYTLLAPFQIPGRTNVLVDAPLFSGLRSTIRVNTTLGRSALVQIGTDTARLSPSPLNPLSAEGGYRFSRTGWQPIADSLCVFVDTIPGNTVGENRLVAAYALAHETQAVSNRPALHPAESSLPDWVWFVLFVGCFTALWIEPKLG